MGSHDQELDDETSEAQIQTDRALSKRFQQVEPFSTKDIEKIEPSIKHINRISFEEGTALSRLAMTMENEFDALRTLRLACIKYKETLSIRPNDTRALFNWAVSLSQLAALEARTYFRLLKQLETSEKKRKSSSSSSSSSSPDHQRSGNIKEELYRSAQEINRLFGLAYEKYQTALELNSNDQKALYMWANTLSQQASLTLIDSLSPNPSNLLYQACEKYHLANQLLIKSPSFAKDQQADLLYNHGCALLRLINFTPQTHSDKQQIRQFLILIDDAISKFQSVVLIDPTCVNALHNLAVTTAKKVCTFLFSSRHLFFLLIGLSCFLSF